MRFNAVLKTGKERESGNVSLTWNRGAIACKKKTPDRQLLIPEGTIIIEIEVL